MATFGTLDCVDADSEVRGLYHDIMAIRRRDYINNFWKVLAMIRSCCAVSGRW